GMAHVHAAQSDGRWDRAYAPIRSKSLPPELLAAIEADPKALETLAMLDSKNRFALAFRIGNLKTAAARERKISEFVAMLARGETLHPNAPPRAGKAPTRPRAAARESTATPRRGKATAQRAPAAAAEPTPARARVKKRAARRP
ncbi:MAG TPA: YdeI/OmpD-associated family protein, partial [Polyangiaceae bacterium]|nr:YdeI/OmpD-associated family protein [Polyangiaceae bacterium]